MSDYRPVHRQTQTATIAPSLVRTVVPFIAGLLGTWLVSAFGVNVDTGLLGAGLTAIIGYAYYTLARFLEVFVSDKWGYVLGLRRLPVYAHPPLPDTVVAEPRDQFGQGTAQTVGIALIVLGAVGLVLALLGHFSVWVAVVLVVVGFVLAAVA